MGRADNLIPENLLLIGKVVKPHGVRGWLKVRVYSDSSTTFSQAGSIFIHTRDDRWHERELISVKPHKGHFLVELKGVDTRNKAEELRDADIYISKDILQKEEGEFFWYELIGLKVYLVSGKYLGKIVQILPTGSNDVYIVKEKEKEYLIPAIEDVIKEVNIEAKKMIIEPLEGLLELAETKKKKKKRR